jgi:hypothetical protein
LLVASTAALNGATDGRYRYYVFGELAQQPWAHQEWVSFWLNDIVHRQWPLLILLASGALTLVRRVKPCAELRSPALYYAVAAVGLICSAWVSRLHTGGYANVLMPAYAATALVSGLIYGALRRGNHARIVGPLLALTILAQLGLLIYPVSAQIPTAADQAAGNQLITRLRVLPGPVVVLRHPWYATLAGKGTFAQEEAIDDVLRSASTRGARALRASLRGALNVDNVQAVVLDGTFDAHLFGAELTRDFRLQSSPITPSRLYPLTDVRTAPTLLYLRTEPRPGRAREPVRQRQHRNAPTRNATVPTSTTPNEKACLGKTKNASRPRTQSHPICAALSRAR